MNVLNLRQHRSLQDSMNKIHQPGGSNGGMQDKCCYRYIEPALAYTDDFCSYASNEIAINGNAPLVYLAHAIEAVSVSVYRRPAGK